MKATTNFQLAAWKRSFRRRVFAWFSRYARVLPWRQTRDPYAIWVSEIMLQQTQVATVIPYFERFLAALPDVHALAAAPEEEVLRIWEGLGYYRRARQMHRAGQVIVEQYGGQFPKDIDAAQALPGIGRYTAGAILSIAHDAPHPILEANTVRLFSRLMALRGDPTSARARNQLWQFAEDILPEERVGTFNQALMELGATVCTPREPKCSACPVASLCPTQARGLHDRIPAPARRVKYEESHEACVVVWRRQHVLLRRCGEGERWSGLWDFPRFTHPDPRRAVNQQLVSAVQKLTGVLIEPAAQLATFKHGVTRYRITLVCYQGSWREGKARSSETRWVKPQELGKLPLSMTARKIATLIAG